MDSQSPLAPVYGQLQSRIRISEEIRSLGFEAQNQCLMQMGFTKLSQNLKYLKKYRGDVQLIVAELSEKSSMVNYQEEFRHISNYEDKALKNYKNYSISSNKFGGFQQEKYKQRMRRPKALGHKVELKNYLEWPSEINRLYLDGNNMLYVESAIRELAITQRKREAEKVLTDLVLQFTNRMEMFDSVLVFDETPLTFNENITTSKGVMNISVTSAIPNFKSSDDALVAWSEGLMGNNKRCLFVTSDKELQTRLIQTGAEHIMKTGRWFKFVKAYLGEARYNGILNRR